MGEYNLEPGEFVISQERQASLGVGTDAEQLEEVVLTNRNLILVANVSEGLFKKARYLKRCPLDSLCNDEGAPQVVATKQGNVHVLRLGFADEALTLRLGNGDKKTANRWCQDIIAAVVGDLGAIRGTDGNSSELDGISNSFVDLAITAGDATSDLFGWKAGAGVALAGSLAGMATKGLSALNAITEDKKRAESTPKKKAATTTGRCRGCHAPLSGRSGAIVVCPYCDTKQTI